MNEISISIDILPAKDRRKALAKKRRLEVCLISHLFCFGSNFGCTPERFGVSGV